MSAPAKNNPDAEAWHIL